MSPLAGRVVAVALAARVAVAVAGRVAVVVGTRGGAGGVGGASTATGAGIAAGGRLADQGADGAICWRSIDGWLLPADAADRLACSIECWVLGCPITDVAPGAARTCSRYLTNAAAARVLCLNQCAPASRSHHAGPVQYQESCPLDVCSTGPSLAQWSMPPRDASDA